MRIISQTTTGCPQIVTLEGSCGSNKHRRLRRRIRYPYRTAHARVLHTLPRLRLGVLNTQGWAWHRLDTNNVDKSDDIVQIARTQGFDFLALPDTHSEATWVSVNHKHGHAHTRSDNIKDTTIALEEFTIITAGRVSILLSPAAVKAWQTSGAVVHRHAGGRLITLEVRIKHQNYMFIAGYAPTSNTDARRAFFEEADDLRQITAPTTIMVWMGDWNSHVGRNSSGQPGVGRCALSTPTTPTGKEFLTWISSGVRDLAIIDSYHALSGRGIWHLSRKSGDGAKNTIGTN